MPVKYCRKEHNVAEGCNTLQLGTFEYYRELDPSFTIADIEEGFIHIETQLGDNFEVSFEQWNHIFGEAFYIGPDGSIKPGANRNLPGNCSFNAKDGNFEFDVERKILKFSGNINFRLYYPNSYIFCMSLDDPKNPKDPRTISPEYDSFYDIPESKVRNLGSYIASLIIKNLKTEQLRDLDKLKSMPVSVFKGGFVCNSRIFPVEYIDEKRILLKNTEQFEKSKLIELYFQSLYQKNSSYKDDRELRMIFSLVHPQLGHLSVTNEPLILDLKEILKFLN